MAEKIYTDNKKSTYTNDNARSNDPSAVSSTKSRNEYIDESYRDINDGGFRPQFSDLKNNYMITSNSHDARGNFWGKQYSVDRTYRNNNADIEDPIFTGFTLSIDKLNSPLFYTIGQYDGVAAGRTKSDGSTFVRNIADEIENCLKRNYHGLILSSMNSYDIVATLTKDKYPDGGSVGYGIQENVYLDGLPYGATEYIYMVDRKVENVGSATDREGHMSLGDGGETVSITDVKNTSIITNDISILKGDVKNLDSKLNDKDVKKEHNANQKAYDNAQKKYDKANKPNNSVYKNRNEEIDAEIKLLQNGANMNVVSILQNEFKETINKLNNSLTALKPNGNKSSRSKSEYDNVCKNIDSYCSKIESLIAKYNGNPSAVQSLIGVDKSIINVTEVSIKFRDVQTSPDDYRNLPLDNSSKTYDGSESYLKAMKYGNISYNVKHTKATDTESRIRELKAEREMLDSQNVELQKELNDAYTKMNSDTYSQLSDQKESTEARIQEKNIELEEIENVNKTKISGLTAAQDAQLHTGDTPQVIKDDANIQQSNKKAEPKAPQTVYDMLGFIRGMTRLTTEYPYMLQSITGLDEAYKNNYMVKDSFRGSGDNKISISIYESLDLKVTGMFNKYFNAVYDAQYRRERVPVNLRRFNCSVFVHDIRNFLLMTTKMGRAIRDVNNNGNLSKIIEIALNSMSAIEFKFYGCEIVAEETGSLFDNVSNADRGDMRMTNFVFTYSDCVINYLPFEDLKNMVIGSQKNEHVPYNNKGIKELQKIEQNSKHQSNYNVPDTLTTSGLNTHISDGRVNGIGNVNDNDTPERKKLFEEFVTSETYRKSLLQQLDARSSASTGINASNVYSDYYVNTDIYDSIKGINATKNSLNFVDGIGKVYDNNTEQEKKLYQELATSETYEKSLLQQLAASVSASTGINASNVYSSYLDRYNMYGMSSPSIQGIDATRDAWHFVNGIGNVNDNDLIEPSSQYQSNGNVPNTPTTSGLNTSSSRGYVNGIGNVNDNDMFEDKPNVDYTAPHIEGTSTFAPNGIIESLGDVIDDSMVQETITYIEDAIEDPTYGRNIKYINNVYTPTPTQPNIIDLGDVIPDTKPKPDIDNIGNVYPKILTPSNVKNIGDVIPDTKPNPNITGLGDVYPTTTTPANVKNLGDVIPTTKPNPNVKKLGDVYPATATSSNITYIDDVIPNTKPNPNVKKLGDVYPTTATPSNITYIDDVIPNTKPNPNIGDLGDVIPDSTQNPNIEYIDNVYQKQHKTSNVKDLGDVIPDSEMMKKIKKLDKLNFESNDNPIVDDLGNV